MHKTPEITRLIHDNLWVVASFAFSRPVIEKVIREQFLGEWKYLHKTVFERSEVLADRALLQMASQIRVLDDDQGLTHIFTQVGGPSFGTVIQSDGTITELYLRDMTNKIMHAATFEWDLSKPEKPLVTCHPRDKTRWTSAEISVVALMGFVDSLGV